HHGTVPPLRRSRVGDPRRVCVRDERVLEAQRLARWWDRGRPRNAVAQPPRAGGLPRLHSPRQPRRRVPAQPGAARHAGQDRPLSGKGEATSNDSLGSATYEAPGASVSRPVGRLVEVVDRFFFLIWIGFYLLLPVSGWASVMFGSWLDQKRDLAALRGNIHHRHAPAIAHHSIGPRPISRA